MLFMLVGFEQAKKDATKLADTIFINGNVYTVEAKQPWAEAVAIKNGEIIYVGNTKGAKKYKNKNTKIIDLKGKCYFQHLLIATFMLPKL